MSGTAVSAGHAKEHDPHLGMFERRDPVYNRNHQLHEFLLLVLALCG